MNLADQRVLVLGGTSGIGLATAALAAREGAQVVVASSNQRSVDRALATLPDGSAGYAVNLTDPADVARLFEGTGPFDHLIYTAGEPLALMSLDALDLAAARTAFELRYFGALSTVNAALPYLRRDGSITFTTGTANYRPSSGWSVAASITGAIDALVRALAVELAPVRVNAVSAGVIRSPLWDSLPDETREQMYAQLGEKLPLGRVGEPEEVAEAFVYLLRSSYATGTIVTVDGGTLVA
ncbi:NAD(P)-dependent dehydrogenase (short-subunit alcohol dehydrogenase family) [Micromonospora pisi]|uniref:NAD(P)-dependent dehydrogenase (Short-subunit alcohol dehydrogenase family) n=1 Tax=Micromonospora pisi TaxID=589240 RepID=A0A495JD80_9ACTN|nr:SDR family oxidoreductase [Micromonospora pisi]RKR86314.1 NAD(P)-dependent dehydrogenase (short-subunit alcohol dehydrogenase family) [Micromonospora pisi]